MSVERIVGILLGAFVGGATLGVFCVIFDELFFDGDDRLAFARIVFFGIAGAAITIVFLMFAWYLISQGIH